MKHKNTEKPEEQKPEEQEQNQPVPIGGELEKIREEIDGLQKEKDELFGKLQRLSADYANFQKRVPKQIADTTAYEKEKIIKTLLPILDGFERTLQNTHAAENVDTLMKGVRIIYDQMIGVLKSNDIEQIKTVGEKFEPFLHEAMLQRFEQSKEENIVLEELQKGYKLNGRVIRPARVIINKPVPPSPQNQTAGECETTDDEE